MENPTPWGAEKLFQIIDGRYIRRALLFVTTNLSPEELELALGERRCTGSWR